MTRTLAHTLFKKTDRVALTTDDYNDISAYQKGAVCTVLDTYADLVAIISDDDTDTDNPLWVPAEAVTHVTNVPSVRPRGSDLQPQTPQGVRAFGTGATRDLDANKLDFEGFLSPLVLERYAEHMHKARKMPDGSMRESDNWQLGIPMGVYIKSLWRHFFAVWKIMRGGKVTEVVNGETIEKDLETELCAVLFNASGMLHERLKQKRAGKV